MKLMVINHSNLKIINSNSNLGPLALVTFVSSKRKLVMKFYSKDFHVNPIGRDLVILLITGMLVAITLVTVGLVLVNQL